MKIQEFIDLLGLKGEDCVTGIIGIITQISFDLDGRVLAMLTTRENCGEAGRIDIRKLLVHKDESILKVAHRFSENDIASREGD